MAVKECPVVPVQLTQPTPVPKYTGETWADVADFTVELDAALKECNADKSSILDWSKPSLD